MKFSLSKSLGPVFAVAVSAIALRGELTKWAENIEAGNRLENVFFRTVVLPTGSVPARRPPSETRPELTKLMAATPSDAELYSLRALEDEQQLDFAAAEGDWKKFLDLSADKGAARLALADYYHRRLQSNAEFDALALAAAEPAPASDKLLPDAQQRPWKTYERLIKLVDEQRLDAALGVAQYRVWAVRFPAAPGLQRNFFVYALAHKLPNVAQEVIAAYEKAFPKDEEFPVESRSELAVSNDQALAVYERSFRPLWPPQLVTQYFALLKKTNTLRAYLARARAGVAANPLDLASSARLFYYWQQQGNPALAERALAEFRRAKDTRQSPWTSDELLTLARLFESSHNYDESARDYYALYSLAGSETALGSLARLLLEAPEQPIHFGSGNLSLYRDVATMDPHPGFLNGVLSLILNQTDPPNRAAIEEQSAGPYFRRARAAELVALFESRFPNSPDRPALRESVIEAYSIYGSSDGVIRAGTKFLADFPNAPNRVTVALKIADAYARRNQTQQEFAAYDRLLVELGKRAGGVPLGALPLPPSGAPKGTPQYDLLHSPDYARVLDRYVARLVSMKRIRDALALYRREIDRNPSDPGLYDTLAAFLEQNRMGADTEQIYQRAIAQFQDHTWEHKLARWYLRQRRRADVARLTEDVVKIFSGTELDSYFREIVGQGRAQLGPAMYLQLNVFAHQRFPHNLTFVHNLLTAYTAAQTRNDAAYEALLRQHWYAAEDLRMRFFERLSRTGKLDAELAALRAANPAASAGRWPDAMNQNPAVVRLLAEGEAWHGHFENAAPMFLAIEASFPADRVIGRRTASMVRSLGTIQPRMTDTGIAVEAKLSQADPRDDESLTKLGEMEAERGRFDRAAASWNRIPGIEPAKPDGYLEAATIFWDYYRYDDALRLIDQARQRRGQPSLYAYEAGAIRENQRDFDGAIAEYGRGAIAQSGPNAQRRLLTLARRPAQHARVEQLTVGLVSGPNPELGAFRLRVALLENQNRRDDLEKFLLDLAGRSTTPELLSAIENSARIDGYPKIQQAAIEREATVSTDPVDRMRLRLALARFLEGQGQQGAQVIDAVYRENPAILGVVRATVDYHWRNHDAKRAVDVLEEAAARAASDYRKQFTLEAARKAIDAGDYARARGFAAKLLQDDPHQPEYVAAMAETYARAGDDRGLRSFYDAKIRELGAEDSQQTTAMRRALIPVLTRMKDFSAGVNQYIEILNKFPEDDGLTQEAALYASSNRLAGKLHDYYVKASSDSPRDYRWPMVLARIETQLEDYPAAIASYTRAAGVRPDRADLLTARLNLEERLLRFDEAAASAQKLFDLTYRNPHWMEKVAELRARQGQTAAVMGALNKAFLEGRPDRAENFLKMAEDLEKWGMLPEARQSAEQALKLDSTAVSAYARILTRLRDYAVVFARMAAAKDPAASVMGASMGDVVATDYSPDEKMKFAAALQGQPQRLVVAEHAGLVDLQAKWLAESMIALPTSSQLAQDRDKLIQLQRQRLAFGELGTQLEALDRAHPGGAPPTDDLDEAAASYRASGDTTAELRVLELQQRRSPMKGPLFDRYCQLLLAQPQQLAAAIRRGGEPANAILNYLIDHGTEAAARQGIAARGQTAGPLWTKAYTALAGLYFGNASAPVSVAFTGMLGDMTIGSRIGKPVDRNQQLAGDQWFYYGSRYGEYLGATKQPGAEDFLPSMVEATPGRAGAYFELAEYTHDPADYRRALDLDPARAEIHDRLAQLAFEAGRRDEAVQEWKLALAGFAQMMDRARVSPKFWGDLEITLRHIGAAKALPLLRDDAERILRLYIRRNGSFQVEPLLEGALAASADAAAGVTWIADLSVAAADPVQFLGAVVDRSWIPQAQKDILYRRIVEAAQEQFAQSLGEPRLNAQEQILTWQLAWIEYLLERQENTRASQILSALPADVRKQRFRQVVPLEIRIAARLRNLPAQLARYEDPLPLDSLRDAANELTKHGDAPAARRVLEFVYYRRLQAGNFDASNFLGLAEIRLAEVDAAGAMALLRRMALISGDAFSSLAPAAALMERTGHPNEAAEFLTALVKAEPWNADAHQRLAQIQGSVADLTAIAKSTSAPYPVRVQAALALRKLKAPALTGTDSELELLSSPAVLTEVEVSKPYYAEARLQAAAESRDAAARERLLQAAIAIDPKRSETKLDLFRVALAAHHDQYVVAVAAQLTPSYLSNERDFSSWVADGFLAELPLPDRVAIARGLGEANQRLGDLRAALFYNQIALRLAPTDAVRRNLETLRAQLENEAANLARRPVVSDNLDQDRLVRPKVGLR